MARPPVTVTCRYDRIGPRLVMIVPGRRNVRSP
jgi:hypothetical protein